MRFLTLQNIKFLKRSRKLYLIIFQGLNYGTIKLSKSNLNKKSNLANYLLGNYYYNISDGGYYRNIMYGWANGGYSGYFTTYGYNKKELKKQAEAVLFAAGNKIEVNEIARLCRADVNSLKKSLKKCEILFLSAY